MADSTESPWVSLGHTQGGYQWTVTVDPQTGQVDEVRHTREDPPPDVRDAQLGPGQLFKEMR